MKGIVLTTLQKMIEEKMGLSAWDKIVTNNELESGGSYTAAATYDAKEVFTIVGAISAITGQSADAIVRAFGRFMLKTLATKYDGFFKDTHLKPFLLSVDRVIHIEVRKLYPGAELPEFSYVDSGDDRKLIMVYRSNRKLCTLAEGLIEGAAEVFGQNVAIVHSECMHRGASCCRLELEIGEVSDKEVRWESL